MAATAETREVAAARSAALLHRVEAIDVDRPPADAAVEALALALVDSVLAGDGDALEAALPPLRERRHGLARLGERTAAQEQALGWLTALIALAHWALERLPSSAATAGLAEGTHAWHFLRALAGAEELTSARLRTLLETDESQVSRTGRHLLGSGLVVRRQAGRHALWSLTPRGRQVLELVGRRGRTRPGRADAERTGAAGGDWARNAIRAGYDDPVTAARHQMHGAPDDTRDRIIDATAWLHETQGIVATTWEQIAKQAQVPVETVSRYFPSYDELLPACGGLALRRMRIPPPERAAEVLEPATTQHERLDRLVDVLFDIYERGALGLLVLRREHAALDLLEVPYRAVNDSLDALVRAALPESHQDDDSVAAARAITDVMVWRSLQGHEVPDAAGRAVVTAALARWLETA